MVSSCFLFNIRDSLKLSSYTLPFFTGLFICFYCLPVTAQVSVPERSPLMFSVRGGLLSNNGDLAAQIRLKSDYDQTWSVNTYYAAAAEAVLGIDLIRLRKTDIVLHISALASEPEIRAKNNNGDYRLAMSQVGIARATLTFSFNSDGYKMFAMPWHTNHEAILGVTGAMMMATNLRPTDFATDTLGISEISGDRAVKSIGLTFGWNWRIASSGWVIGLNGSVMWYADEKSFLDFKTTEGSLYNPDRMGFAPRILEAGIGYHF